MRAINPPTPLSDRRRAGSCRQGASPILWSLLFWNYTEMYEIIESLEGRKTADGWLIGARVAQGKEQTGGAFSVGYLATNETGNPGFFKVLDFRKALDSDDPARALQELTSAYNFERDILAACAQHRMSRVVTAVSSGFLSEELAPLGRLFYLIFELAEGDVRKQIRLVNRQDGAWSVAAMHHIAVGLQQLHNRGISHQDIKPSNVLIFDQGTLSKLADLGRAHSTTLAAPHDEFSIPGASSYAPPEQLYGFANTDRVQARRASDLYLLGSMLNFLFVGTGLSVATCQHLQEQHLPTRFGGDAGWGGTYTEVLPYYREAYVRALMEFNTSLKSQLSPNSYSSYGTRLVNLLKYLTDPDPALRGHPASRSQVHSNPLDLQRIVSELGLISRALSLSRQS